MTAKKTSAVQRDFEKRGPFQQVPIRVVAATHNTSVAHVERHYSRYIVDHTDDLTRAALLPEEPDVDNVVALRR